MSTRTKRSVTTSIPTPPLAAAPSSAVTKKIFRMTELTRAVGLSRAWINRLVHDGAFPRPIKLGPRSIGFLVTEVDAWLAARAAERDRSVA